MRKGHPHIDLGMKVLPRTWHAPLHVLAQAVLAAIALFMTFHAWGELAGTIRFGTVTNTPLKTPLWVPQGLWVAGTATFALVAVTNTLHGLWLLARAGAGPDFLRPDKRSGRTGRSDRRHIAPWAERLDHAGN